MYLDDTNRKRSKQAIGKDECEAAHFGLKKTIDQSKSASFEKWVDAEHGTYAMNTAIKASKKIKMAPPMGNTMGIKGTMDSTTSVCSLESWFEGFDIL
jgi:hypothetical protein